MSVTIRLSSMLRLYSGSASELSSAAATVGAVLEELKRDHASLYRSICDDTGAVRRHVNVFVNMSNVRDLDALNTRLQSGDVITILPAVSGG